MTIPRLDDDAPVVSIVVPMLNELGAIDDCLDSFAAQRWPKELLEVIVVDGGSDDGSRESVEARAIGEPWIRVIDNPRRKAAAAFNCGVEAAKGAVVCLFSAHGVADPEYIARSVEVLRAEGVAGVGGRYLHVGTDPASRAIGLAMVSPFGMASPHRFAAERGEVDTISHPAYVADALAVIDPFDETLERNSDYELNYRLRAAGGRLMLDPRVESIYRPRPDLRALARQFWWYGRWKARVVQRHPKSLRLRHLAPPLAVASLLAAPVLLRTRRGRTAVVAAAIGYAGVLALAVRKAAPADHEASGLVFVMALPTMHASWGAGFLASVVEDALRNGAGRAG